MKPSMRNKSEVELRVAQELKNNRDFIYDTNQTLQNLSQGIVNLSLQHEKCLSNSHSERKKLLIEFENVREDLMKSQKKYNQRLSDVEIKVKSALEDIKDFKDEISSEYATTETLVNCLLPYMKKMCDIEKRQDLERDRSSIDNRELNYKLEYKLSDLKKELTPKIPEVDPVMKHVNELFEIFKIDFAGLVREIELLKKKANYDQKKFENIYTLIGRLKEKKI